MAMRRAESGELLCAGTELEELLTLRCRTDKLMYYSSHDCAVALVSFLEVDEAE